MPSPPVVLRRLKFWLRLFQAYIKKYQIRLGAVFLILLILTIAAVNIWPNISKSNVVSIGYIGSYTVENLPTEVLALVTQPLISTDENGRPAAALSSHWQVSGDGKTYIVFLKDNLKWHDESQVDTSNISLAITGVEITALNNKAIEFKLDSPISSFPQTLDKPVFKTKSFYGTGNYRIVKIDRIENIVKKIILHPKEKNLPQVEIKFYQSQEQAAYALKIGEVKSARITEGKSFENWQNLVVEQETDFSQIVTLFFNNEDTKVASKDLRQALIFAINRAQFDGETAHSPISPTSWAYNQSTKRYSYNIGKSKELLSKLPDQNIELKLSVSPGLEKIAQSIKQDWEAIGLKVAVENFTTTPKDFQILLAVNELTPDPDQYAMWHSIQEKTNITNYQNVRVDKLLEDARSTQNEEERKELYLDFQETLVEDAPAAFLYHPHKYKITYKNIIPLLEKLPES